MRISIGPNSTMRVSLLTGPPFTGTGDLLSPSTLQFIFFIPDFSWFADKFVSFNSLTWKKHNTLSEKHEISWIYGKDQRTWWALHFFFFFVNFHLVLAQWARSMHFPHTGECFLLKTCIIRIQVNSRWSDNSNLLEK